MRTFPHSVTIWLLLVVLTSCANIPKPTESPQPAEITVPTQTIQSTQVMIPTDLAFSTPLVQVLSQSGLSILSVQSSTYMAMFPSTNKAVWIKTNEGIIEAVFFADSAEVEQIHITERPNEAEVGRYLYTIQAPPPTQLHDLRIDAAFRLYFTTAHDMLMETSSAELDKTLKHIFSGQ
jgi:hypothetical protein